MNLLRVLLFPLLGRMRAPQKAAPPPRAKTKGLHIFHGTFASEVEATDYCLTPLGRNQPAPLGRDLADAHIDLSEVEIIFGQDRIHAATPMLTPQGLRAKIGSDNTVIMIADAGVHGPTATLGDTPALRYAGVYDAL